MSRQDKQLLSLSAQPLSLATPDFGVLHAFLHTAQHHDNSKPLVVLLHGWEGSIESGYIMRTTALLLKQRFQVLRLNFRDHGNNHHMNLEPFNSARLDEVKQAICMVLERFNIARFHLVGFSLGGNFVLRLAANPADNFQPERIISICPPIDPLKTSWDIEAGPAIYHRYFVKRWHRSLSQKYRYYPELMQSHQDLYLDQKLQRKPSLNQMNAIFVPKHTEFAEVNAYLNAYKIDQASLERIQAKGLLVYSQDDPIICVEQFKDLHSTASLSLYRQAHGGHCGFLQALPRRFWLDSLITEFLQPHR